jgi:hypothetical protein
MGKSRARGHPDGILDGIFHAAAATRLLEGLRGGRLLRCLLLLPGRAGAAHRGRSVRSANRVQRFCHFGISVLRIVPSSESAQPGMSGRDSLLHTKDSA